MHSSVVSSVVHKLIYKDYFPIFSLFVILLVLSDSLGTLWLEVWDFIYPVLPLIPLNVIMSGAKQWNNKET